MMYCVQYVKLTLSSDFVKSEIKRGEIMQPQHLCHISIPGQCQASNFEAEKFGTKILELKFFEQSFLAKFL